jgi:hypothetical protein
MNKISRKQALAILLGAAASAAATLALAAQPQTVQIRPQSTYSLSPDDFDAAYAHRYDLNNGQTLKLRHSPLRYFVRLAGAPEVELFPQARDVFLTSTGATVLFRDDGDTVVVRGFEKMPGHGPLR